MSSSRQRNRTSHGRLPAGRDFTFRQLFSTPVGVMRLRALQRLNRSLLQRSRASIRESIRLMTQAERTRRWHIRRGWEIGPRFFEVLADDPVITEARSCLEEAVRSFVRSYLRHELSKAASFDGIRISASWLTATSSGAFLTDEHVHYGADLVGIYYVKVPALIDGRDDDAGFLVLRDPRVGMHASRLHNQRVVRTVRPREGTLIILPGYISHAVRPFWTGGERVSLNFNVQISGLR